MISSWSINKDGNVNQIKSINCTTIPVYLSWNYLASSREHNYVSFSFTCRHKNVATFCGCYFILCIVILVFLQEKIR